MALLVGAEEYEDATVNEANRERRALKAASCEAQMISPRTRAAFSTPPPKKPERRQGDLSEAEQMAQVNKELTAMQKVVVNFANGAASFLCQQRMPKELREYHKRQAMTDYFSEEVEAGMGYLISQGWGMEQLKGLKQFLDGPNEDKEKAFDFLMEGWLLTVERQGIKSHCRKHFEG